MITKQERDAAVLHPVCKLFAQGWSQPLSQLLLGEGKGRDLLASLTQE